MLIIASLRTHGFISLRCTIYFFHERNQSVMHSVSFSTLLDPQLLRFSCRVLILVSLLRSSRISLLSSLHCTDRSFFFVHVVLSPDLQISQDDRPYTSRSPRRRGRAVLLKLAPARFADKDTCHAARRTTVRVLICVTFPELCLPPPQTFTPRHSVSTLYETIPLSLCTPADFFTFTNRSLFVLRSRSIVI